MMGITPIKDYNKKTGKTYYYYNNPEMGDYEALPEYKEWNNLMPVVEFINKREWVTIKSNECSIRSYIVGEFENISVEFEGGDLNEIIFIAVLAYAKIYEKLK